MKRIRTKATESINDLIQLLKSEDDNDLILTFSKDNEIYKYATNLQILKKAASQMGKSVKFEAENKKHKNYVDAINSGEEVPADNPGQVQAKTFSTKRIWLKLPGFKFSFKSKKFKYLFGTPVVLLLIGGFFFFLWWYIPTAKVEIQVDSEVLVKLLDIKASAKQQEVSVESATIPAILVEVTETETQTAPSTGEKETGEKSTGKVKLYNKTDDDITIKKGATLKLIETDKESLRFVTTKEAKVPAQKEGDLPPPETGTKQIFGTQEVEVEAVEFGDGYNLDDGQKFEVGDYDTDELVAENEDSISGGSQKIISVVTQSDLDSLKRSLNEFLENKVGESLQKKVVTGQKLAEASVQFTEVTANFDKKPDDEADQITLELALKGTGIAYSTQDLDDLISKLIVGVIPDEYNLEDSNPDYELAEKRDPGSENVLSIQAKLRSYIMPRLDEVKIKSDLTGMRLPQAQQYLEDIKNIKGFKIDLSPNMPLPLQTMPHVTDNIELEINKL